MKWQILKSVFLLDTCFPLLAIAMLWLCVVEKTSPKTAVKKIFDKRIWFSKSSLADFKIILINRVIMSAGAAAVVSQLTISTLLYNLLHEQTLIQPLAFHATSASMVAILFTAFFSYLTISRDFLYIA